MLSSNLSPPNGWPSTKLPSPSTTAAGETETPRSCLRASSCPIVKAQSFCKQRKQAKHVPLRLRTHTSQEIFSFCEEGPPFKTFLVRFDMAPKRRRTEPTPTEAGQPADNPPHQAVLAGHLAYFSVALNTLGGTHTAGSR